MSSLLCIETADRPGLLVEIIKIIADCNVDVESAEIDTEVLNSLFPHSHDSAFIQSSSILYTDTSLLQLLDRAFSILIQQGLVAKDKFHVSYGGAALNSSLSQVF